MSPIVMHALNLLGRGAINPVQLVSVQKVGAIGIAANVQPQQHYLQSAGEEVCAMQTAFDLRLRNSVARGFWQTKSHSGRGHILLLANHQSFADDHFEPTKVFSVPMHVHLALKSNASGRFHRDELLLTRKSTRNYAWNILFHYSRVSLKSQAHRWKNWFFPFTCAP